MTVQTAAATIVTPEMKNISIRRSILQGSFQDVEGNEPEHQRGNANECVGDPVRRLRADLVNVHR